VPDSAQSAISPCTPELPHHEYSSLRVYQCICFDLLQCFAAKAAAATTNTTTAADAVRVNLSRGLLLRRSVPRPVGSAEWRTVGACEAGNTGNGLAVDEGIPAGGVVIGDPV
jgi:hypothetical protein